MNSNLKEIKGYIKTNQAELKANQVTTNASVKKSQDGCTSREDGGHNTLHPARVRGDHQTSGGKSPVMCQLKGGRAFARNSTRNLSKDRWACRQ
jgi:hypothetical protein